MRLCYYRKLSVTIIEIYHVIMKRKFNSENQQFCVRVRVAHDFCLLCVFMFWVPTCDVRYDFSMKTMFGSSLSPVVSSMSYSRCLCLLCIVVVNKYCVLFCFVFPRLVWHMLPVSLDFPFLIVPSVFSNVYFYQYQQN